MEEFNVDDIETQQPTPTNLPRPVPQVRIFKYRDKWAVCALAGDNFIFPTIGQAFNEARIMIEEMDRP